MNYDEVIDDGVIKLSTLGETWNEIKTKLESEPNDEGVFTADMYDMTSVGHIVYQTKYELTEKRSTAEQVYNTKVEPNNLSNIVIEKLISQTLDASSNTEIKMVRDRLNQAIEGFVDTKSIDNTVYHIDDSLNATAFLRELESDPSIDFNLDNYFNNSTVTSHMNKDNLTVADLLEIHQSYRTEYLNAKYEFENTQGRLVTIYKTNGEIREEVFDASYGISVEKPKHILGVAFVGNADYDADHVIAADVIASLVGMAGAGVIGVVGSGLSTSGVKLLQDCVDDVRSISNDFTQIANNIAEIDASSAIVSGIINTKDSLSNKLHELTKNYSFGGLNDESVKLINDLKTISMAMLPLAVPSAVIGIAVSAGLQQLIENYKNKVSALEGERELERFMELESDPNNPSIVENLLVDRVDQLSGKALNFTTIIADGKLTNTIQGNNLGNYIEVVDGNTSEIDGLEGDDVLLGYSGLRNDNGQIVKMGKDTLKGGADNDYLDGRGSQSGSDVLEGGSGVDQYIFEKFYGSVEIIDNTIDNFGQEGNSLVIKGYQKEDVYFEFSNDGSHDVHIKFKNNIDDTIILKEAGGFFVIYTGKLEKNTNISEITFADSNETVNLREWVFMAADNRDILVEGNNFDNQIYGLDHNDTIVGGLGNDRLSGGLGSDTYIYNVGDGKDTLYEVESQTDRNIIKIEGTQSVSLNYSNGDEIIRVGSSNSDSESIRIIDGASKNLIDRITASNEDGRTHLGLKGNDTFENEDVNNDTYIFRAGDGTDTIIDYVNNMESSLPRLENAGQDKIMIQGYTSNESNLSKAGSDLIIDFSSSPTDKIIVKNFFSVSTLPGEFSIEQIKFDDDDTFRPLREYYDSESINVLPPLPPIEIDHVIEGTNDAEIINGTIQNDEIYGYDGNDSINGGQGDDIIEGGSGKDTLKGYRGNDIYIFSRGFGQDIIDGDADNGLSRDLDVRYDSASVDTIRFTDINSDEIEWEVSQSNTRDLLIKVKDSNDVITLKDHLVEGSTNSALYFASKKINRIEFGNGEVWGQELVTEKLNRVVTFGTAAADTLFGATGESIVDVLYGLEGSDDLHGQSGNDELYGGIDNDKLYGGYGNDTLDGGSGTDTLEGSLGNDNLNGGSGNDTLDGGEGDDILEGGIGNDTLKGYRGNDTYVFSRGFGQDTIDGNADDDRSSNLAIRYDYASVDTLRFTDINSDEIEFILDQSNTRNLKIRVIGTSDVITLKDHLMEDSSNSVYYASRKINRIEFGNGEVWEQEQVTENLKRVTSRGTAGDDVLQGSTANNIIDVMYGLEGSDDLYGQSGDDELYGGLDNDNLYGGYGNDTLRGGTGNDTLDGDKGDDILEGGSGNDTLKGYRGNDTYVFSRGFGQDVIDGNADDDRSSDLAIRYDYASVDTLRFTDINSDEIEFILDQSNTRNLKIRVIGTSDVITLKDHLMEDSSNSVYFASKKINRIEFGNGEVWEQEQVTENLKRVTSRGTAGDDVLQGSTANNIIDVMYGLEGSDDLYGQSGNDELYGGLDNDKLYGGYGNDTLDGGSGTDTLEGSLGNDNLNGGSGNDTLDGGEGDDILEGGSGNDTLKGYRGNDTYVFSRGFGQDVIDGNADDDRSSNLAIRYDYASVDTLRFTDINSDEIEFILDQSNTRNLKIRVIGTSDVITLKDHLMEDSSNSVYFASKKINRIEFGNGEVWEQEQVTENLKRISGYGTNGNDTLYGSSANNTIDVLYGLEGSDTLYGQSGNDELHGGEGNDKLYGGFDNDTLKGGSGNDTLDGEKGNDILEGGSGNDTLKGYRGNDTYVFSRGFGQDIIDGDADNDLSRDLVVRYDATSIDTLRFTDINSDEIEWEVSQSNTRNLLIKVKDSNDVITLKDHLVIGSTNSALYFASKKINRIEFGNGEVWEQEQVTENLNRVATKGTTGNDTLYGANENGIVDKLYGLEGADVLYGQSGNDELYGGIGNDDLQGGYGNDTYSFKTSDGVDTITDTHGNDVLIHQTSIFNTIFSLDANRLTLEFNNSNDKITVNDNAVETFVFGNEHRISNQQLSVLIQAVNEYCSTNSIASWEDALETNQQQIEGLISQYVESV